MFFLATILFTVTMYVIPGAWLLSIGLRSTDLPLLLDPIAFWVASLLIYTVLVIIVRFGRYAYAELQMEREGSHGVVKSFLDARGSRWLTLAGIVLVGGQLVYMSSRFAVPDTFVPLYAALLVGFLDLRRRPVSLEFEEELPGARFQPGQSLTGPESREVRFEWEYLAKGSSEESERFELCVAVSKAAYEKAVASSLGVLSKPEDYERYASRGPLDEVRVIAATMRKMSDARAFTRLQEVENVVRMVRSIPYVSDPPGKDRPKFPVMTLWDAGGDCEDHAILAAALLWQMGHSVGLIYVETKSGAHMALGYATDAYVGSFSVSAADGRSYAYIETVPSSAGLGEVPDAVLEELNSAVVVPLV